MDDKLLIGLTGWGDHTGLYGGTASGKEKLKAYSAYFPVVEVDSSFYAVQPRSNYERWVADTPDRFRFLIKANQGMTGHQRERGGPGANAKQEAVANVLKTMARSGGEEAAAASSAALLADGGSPAERQARPGDSGVAAGTAPEGDDGAARSLAGLFRAFRESIAPVLSANKLFAVLFQYPPWFECTRENVETLRRAKAAMGDIPVALEFRHQSWFAPRMREKTLAFMAKEGWIHSICDEPQAGEGSVPTVLEATDPAKTVVRLHGRNAANWHSSGQPNWRELRYLYNYSEAELAEWVEHLRHLQRHTAQTAVIFNNNSGGHAAGNARRLMERLGIDYEGLAPRQLDLF